MAIYNRRIVYLSDKEWADITKWAEESGLTASAYIRHAVALITDHHPEPRDQIDVAINTVTRKTQQAERDRILARVNRAG